MLGINKQLLNPEATNSAAGTLERNLRKLVIGQDHAVKKIARIYQTFLAGMAPLGRPIGNFLLLGPTGTGKTHIVESLAKNLIGDPRAVVKIDCGEFQHSHEVAKLIGSPPGYLGHRETHPLLSQDVLNQWHTDKLRLTIVLFDEIEKASDALWNLLLGVLDKATLTMGDNRRIDFSRAMIFMTSNVGAKEMDSVIRPGLGFAAAETDRLMARGILDERTSRKIEAASEEAARRKFTPEFMNRMDELIVFQPLGTPELRRILNLELNLLKQRIVGSANTPQFTFSVTESVKEFLLEEGTDIKYGARNLKRAIERRVTRPLANLIATGQVDIGDIVQLVYDPRIGKIQFFKEAAKISVDEVIRRAATA